MIILGLKQLLIALIYLVKQVVVAAIQFILETCFEELLLRMLMLVLGQHLLLAAYQVSSELYFQLDQQLLLIAFIQQALASIHSMIQKLIEIIASTILAFVHQTCLKLVLEPSFLTFQEFFEM
jgi:hypothetical protein